ELNCGLLAGWYHPSSCWVFCGTTYSKWTCPLFILFEVACELAALLTVTVAKTNARAAAVGVRMIFDSHLLFILFISSVCPTLTQGIVINNLLLVLALRKYVAFFSSDFAPAMSSIACGEAQAQRLPDPSPRGMYDISIFIKELKGRFAIGTISVITATGYSGPRGFKSVLLEGGDALAAVAAYIELNPVHTGLCDPLF